MLYRSMALKIKCSLLLPKKKGIKNFILGDENLMSLLINNFHSYPS
jgi:hypothetical protein